MGACGHKSWEVTGAEIKEQGQTQGSCIESSARYKGAGSAKGRQTRLGPGLLHISLALRPVPIPYGLSPTPHPQTQPEWEGWA